MQAIVLVLTSIVQYGSLPATHELKNVKRKSGRDRETFRV